MRGLIVIARHGQSLLNVSGVVNGDPSRDEGLSGRGRDEAARLGRQLAGLTIDAVVVTPFPRTLETARIALGDRLPAPIVEPLLGDIRVGALEGATIAEYRAARAHAERHVRFPGGESLDEAALRYAQAFARLLDRNDNVTLVVTHEIPVRYALNAVEGSERLDGPIHEIANAAPYLFGQAGLRRASERIADLAGTR